MNRAFLKSDGLIYELSECTTIGRRQCGLIIPSHSVEDRHATIHYSKTDDSFLLQDLNTQTGTEVNGYRITIVRLSPGDLIKFGLHQSDYEFCHGKITAGQNNYPPLPRSAEITENFEPGNFFSTPIGSHSSERHPINCRAHVLVPPEEEAAKLREELRRAKNMAFESGRKDKELKQQREIIHQLEDKINSLRNAKDRASQEYLGSNELRQRLQEQLDYKETLIGSLNTKLKEIAMDRRESLVENERRESFLENERRESSQSQETIPAFVIEKNQINREKKILGELVTQMQRDSINKDEIILRQSVEIEKSSRDQDMTEIKTVKKKLKTQETEGRRLSVEIDSVRGDMLRHQQKAEELAEQCQVLEAQIKTCNTQNADLEKAGNITKSTLDKTILNYEQFKSKILSSVAHVLTDCEEISDDVIVREVTRLSKVREVYEDKISFLNSEISMLSENEAVFQSKMTILKDSINKELSEYVGTTSPMSGHLDSLVTKLEGKHGLDSSVAWIRDALINVLSFQSKKIREIEKSFENEDMAFNPSESIPENIFGLTKRLAETRALHEESLISIENLREKFNEDMIQVNQEADCELRRKIEDAIQKSVAEENSKSGVEIEKIREIAEEKLNTYKNEREQKTLKLQCSIDNLCSTIRTREIELESLQQNYGTLVKSEEILKADQTKLIGDVEALRSALKDTKDSKLRELGVQREHYENEALNYREQIKQHSVTICKQEEKLLKHTVKKKMLKPDPKSFKMKNNGFPCKINAELGQEVENRPPIIVPPLPPQVVIDSAVSVDQKNTIHRLNTEIRRLETICHERETVINSVKQELHVLKANKTDSNDGGINRELGEARTLLRRKDEELVVLRQDCYQNNQKEQEIQKMLKKLEKQKCENSKLEESLKDKTKKIEHVQQKLVESVDQKNSAMSQLERYPKANDLMAMGSLCKGERHVATIGRQAEALGELRTRLKEFEILRMQPSADSGMRQQNMILKRRLAEMRAQEALNSNALIRNAMSESKKEFILCQPPAGEHKMDNKFTESETLVLNFVGELSAAVGHCGNVSLHSIVHMPPRQAETLLSERRQIFDMLVSKVSILNDSLQKKCDLLLEFEQDLTRLKFAEKLNSRINEEIDVHLETIRLKTEEIEYMKETLDKYREMLNAERRLNGAIKDKKTFHMENERADKEYRVHKCPTDESLARSESKCKTMFEDIRKKDFIIARQEVELAKRSTELRTRRVVRIESSADTLESEDDGE